MPVMWPCVSCHCLKHAWKRQDMTAAAPQLSGVGHKQCSCMCCAQVCGCAPSPAGSSRPQRPFWDLGAPSDSPSRLPSAACTSGTRPPSAHTRSLLAHWLSLGRGSVIFPIGSARHLAPALGLQWAELPACSSTCTGRTGLLQLGGEPIVPSISRATQKMTWERRCGRRACRCSLWA